MLRAPLALKLARAVSVLFVLGSQALGAQDDAIVTMDREELDAGRGQSLAQFLSARVPGLLVHHVHGVPSAAARVGVWSASGSVAAPEPLLFVDGVLMRDDPHFSARLRTLPRSLGWSLPVDEIEELRIVLGPAAGTSTEFASARGAIYVTTRRPDRTRTVRGALQLMGAGYLPPGAPTYGTRGVLSTGGSTNFCRLDLQVAGSCTAQAQLSWDPLRTRAAYLPAGGYVGSVSATGPIGGWGYRSSAQVETSQGVLRETGMRRSDLAIAAGGLVEHTLRLRVDARYARIEGPHGAWDALSPERETRFLPPEATAEALAALDTIVGHQRREAFLAQSERLSTQLGAEWETAGGARFRARLGQEWQWRSGARTYRPHPALSEWHNEVGASIRSTTASISGARSWAVGRDAQLEVGSGLAWFASDLQDNLREQGGSDGRVYWTSWSDTLSLYSVRGSVALQWTDRLRVYGGIRHESVLGARPEKRQLSGGARWEFLRPSAPRPWQPSLTADLAYGEATDHRTPSAVQWPGPQFLDRDIERAIERRAGVTARWGSRLRLAAWHASHGTRDGLLASNVGPLGITAGGGWRTDQTGLTMHSQSAPRPGSPSWSWTGSAFTRRTVVTHLTGPAMTFNAGGTPRRLEVGKRLHQLVSQRYVYGDANGDGVLVPSEVTLLNDPEVLGSPDPTLIISSGVRVRLAGGMTIGATAEALLGHVVFDEAGAQRCLGSRCRPQYDPTASLADQAAAIAYRDAGRIQGFVHSASIARIRHVFVDIPLRIGTLRLSAEQIPLSPRPVGLDPEASPLDGGVRSGSGSLGQALPTTYSIRIDIGG